MRTALHLEDHLLSLVAARCSACAILFVLLLLLAPQQATAAPVPLDQVLTASSDDPPTAVSSPQQPTEVSVGAYLIGLSRVSAPSEAFPVFEGEMFIGLTWRDHRLAFVSKKNQPMVFLEEEAEEKLSEIWSPDIEIQNEVEQRTTDSVALFIFPDGTVQYEERFGAVLNADLDLRRFPFDKQVLDLEIQSFVWDQTDLKLIVNERQLGMDTEFRTPEWTVTGVDALISRSNEIRGEHAFATFTFRIYATRHAGHYLLRVLMPLMFVMLVTWSVMWTDPMDRVRTGFIALLTVVATHMVIGNSLPRLHYPTFSDILIQTMASRIRPVLLAAPTRSCLGRSYMSFLSTGVAVAFEEVRPQWCAASSQPEDFHSESRQSETGPLRLVRDVEYRTSRYFRLRARIGQSSQNSEPRHCGSLCFRVRP